MKPIELLAVALAYLITVTITYFIAVRFEEDAAGLAQAGGTITAVLIAAWLYQSRSEHRASSKVKLAVGGTLALLAVAQGLAFQQLLKWMEHPDISIFFGALGALVFPFLLWNTFAKSIKPNAQPEPKQDVAQDASKPPIPKP